MPPKPTIAIAGGTGHLGKHITTALLSTPFISSFTSIILLTRSETSSSIPNNPKLQLRKYTPTNLSQALTDIDILINAIGPSGHSFKEALLRAIPKTNIKLYIPSEFGVNHYIHDFPHQEWDAKKRHYALAREILPPQVKVCRVFCGLFMEDSIGPWFGFDTRGGRYESVGSSAERVSFTGLGDVGRVVAGLCRLFAAEGEVPDVVHVAGDTKCVADVARVMEREGGGPIEVTQAALGEYKERVTSVVGSDPAAYLRFLMGEGKINHSPAGLGCDNDLVNPEERVWKWKSLEELARETRGRPWRDLEWPST
ncbi:hypothetical protein BDV32DRAFT_159864 [Aspergillus pseudonomiae]|uniref:NmrA-like domain-containing protein n=1 Tax=Aspergillus pseudonomiae TaxID=1506151 RepID=A0A5N7D7X5_9EURO|nr:uncharacterized protein BDV37DRAFT_295378 [Aspergillus pseudonomiae]KAB8258568.1 hypothetical protein BDV32DRAFT_159864 [Aspergillus pseudonomiae]KAE8402550.1 hypothetical protein BDV37DRAFT_295378 [Aspergillus pseudonomiae]